MEETLIAGTITTSYNTLLECLSFLLDKNKVIGKIRIIGEEINYENSTIYIFIYSLNQKDKYVNPTDIYLDKKDDFQFDCKFYEKEKSATQFLQDFAKILSEKEAEYCFEYKKDNVEIEINNYPNI